MSIESEVGRSVKLTGAEFGDWSSSCTHLYAFVACRNNLAAIVVSAKEIILQLTEYQVGTNVVFGRHVGGHLEFAVNFGRCFYCAK
jgi:hypothetical protein